MVSICGVIEDRAPQHHSEPSVLIAHDDNPRADTLAIDHDARSLGTTGTIIGGVGVAAVVVYVTAPSAQHAVEHAGVQLLPHGGVATWTARF